MSEVYSPSMRSATRRGIFRPQTPIAALSMTPQPLTDAEFDSLSGVLSRYGGKDAMNLEQVDGFLAAVIFPSPNTGNRVSPRNMGR